MSIPTIMLFKSWRAPGGSRRRPAEEDARKVARPRRVEPPTVTRIRRAGEDPARTRAWLAHRLDHVAVGVVEVHRRAARRASGTGRARHDARREVAPRRG